ncbi:MAG: hypothetical protein R8K20_00450, partial [Gallionellaceae bacterium]
MDEEEIPDYIREMQKGGPVKNNTNFGVEDLAWVGSDGKLDPDTVIAKHGQDPFGPLQLLIYALIRGHTPEANHQEIRNRVQRAISAITGQEPKRGKIENDYHGILLEVAWQYFVELHENHMEDNGIELQKIVRKVLGDDIEGIATKSGVSVESLERGLVRKFQEKKDIYLARA